tara:strand:+ start:1379 stop:2419 length:1041 start_codon:yes stop_codon:yes gene_type:complete
MDNEIYKDIIKLLKNSKNPASGSYFDVEKEVNIIVKNSHAIISFNIDPQNVKIFEDHKDIIQKKILEIKNLISAQVIMTSEKKNGEETKKNVHENKYDIPVKNIIAIASGKGGVGKSTVAVNLAIALKNIGKSVVLLDADIYGPSIPRMMGISKKPITNENKKLIPLEAHGIKCMSIGFLISEETPAIWRGPMVMKALEQLFTSVEWGESEYMIVDLPPGTGDTQLTIAQKVQMKGAIIVSTPQDIALIDARKGINMFKKVNIPVLGIIENMSYFICDNCNERHEIFSYGGAKEESIKMQTDFLGEIPLDKKIRICSDQGKPLANSINEEKITKIYEGIAKKIIKY